jgi:hypothetical protein
MKRVCTTNLTYLKGDEGKSRDVSKAAESRKGWEPVPQIIPKMAPEPCR